MLGILGLAILRLIPKAVMISADIAKIRAGRYATDQVYNVYKRLTKDESSLNIGSIFEEKFTNLRLENIFYKYPGTEKYVISDINLEINKGEHIGIQGSSGSGKTTLVDLIIGHLNPNRGEIYFNGKQLNENNYPSFLSNISYIPQKIFLIDDTLKTNIALCDNDEIDLEKLGDSINKANLSELVSSLEHGVESKVGEDGINLSGGQRQRIALARSFYHNKNFIIFDEATSALDNVTADKVVKEIANLKENTVIMISHNRNSMKYCNKIYTIKDNYLRKI
jgi:ABC-type bacteriocin/lantibiotic exporter with double-glycine peptidase domain